MLLDTNRQHVNIVQMSAEIDGGFRHQHIIMKKDDHETSKSKQELGGLNRMMFEINSKESYRVNFNVDVRYNNMISYHNDLELKITIGKFTELKKIQQPCGGFNTEWGVEFIRT